MVDPVFAAELAVFAVLTLPTLFCLLRHLPAGLLGWTYLFLFCTLRIIGGALGVSNPASEATNIVSNIGLSPLLLAVSGLIHEARFLRKPALDKKMELVTVLAFHVAVAVGVALLAVGVSGLYGTHPTPNDLVFIKAGLAFLIACWALTLLFALLSLALASQRDRSSPVYDEGTMLLISILLAIVWIGVRVIYTLVALVSQRASLSPTTGSKGVRVGLVLLPDLFATALLITGGLYTRRAAGKQKSHEVCSTSVSLSPADWAAHRKHPSSSSPASRSQSNGSADMDSFSKLPITEADVLKRQIESPATSVGTLALYRYASNKDLLYLAISTLAAIVAGAVQPLMTIIFGHLQGIFQEYFDGQHTYLEFVSSLNRLVVYFVYLGIASFVANYIATVGFIYVGEHITGKIRSRYLDSCLRQNVGYFDNLGAGEVTTRITADANKIQDGISEKVGLTVTALSTFVTAFIISFIAYWKLTLVLLSTVVVLLLIMLSGTKFVVKFTVESFIAYAPAGSLADEVLATIRNTVAFGAQRRMVERYDYHLSQAEKSGFKAKAVMGVMVAGMTAIVYLNYGLSFWVGSRFVLGGEIALSKVITVMMSVMIGAFSLSNVSPNIQAFIQALGAASKIYSIIDRNNCADLDPLSSDGLVPDSFEGDIRLEKVKHVYPSRPELVALDGISLHMRAGTTTALVGSSGSGKSTIVGLLQRFYYAVGGSIYLDDIDISLLNLRWLRRNVALVQQEPVLFHDTVYENIRKGLIGTQWEELDEHRQEGLITEAAKKANAHEFILSLPQGYHTNVGQRGARLSGGQKQRVAIARAIVSDPKILLLDEATSALDTKSEGIVQLALKNAAKGRTTIIIAHRLSTIRDADNIIVMQQGRIVEQGSHDDLLGQHGAYYDLVTSQTLHSNSEQIGISPTETSEYSESYYEETPPFGRSPGETPVFDSASTLVPGSDSQEDEKTGSTNEKTKPPAKAARRRRSNWGRRKAEAEGATSKKRSYSIWQLIRLIASLNKREWKEMCVAILACIIGGAGFPTQSVFFAELIDALSRPLDSTTIPEIRHKASFWSLMYLMLGLVQFLALSVQGILFARCSERLIHRARKMAFDTYLRQDMEFFDRDENATGAMTSFLSTQTTHLAGLSGATLGVIIMVVTTIVTAVSLALAIGWKLALVCTSTIPILLLCGFFRFWMLAQYQLRAQAAYQRSAAFAAESITAIRTIAALTMEREVSGQYTDSLTKQRKSSLKSILKSSLLYAASQSLTFGAFALGFWYGGDLIAHREYSQFQLFVVFSAVILGSQSAGTLLSFAPDVGKATNASGDLKALFDNQSRIEGSCHAKYEEHRRDEKAMASLTGHVQLRDVHFSYPSRPDQTVLKGLDVDIEPGKFVAFVGASGSGKSTTISLLERFYDPCQGDVLVDGQPLPQMDLATYRSSMALVSQEPTLYMGSIRENILLGAPSPTTITDAEIERVCRAANIWDFVSSLPDGLNSSTGSRGVLLSGGQKQRIAIARALIRKPKILLLDEATSALDGESERVVQEALDKAAEGRTTIAVAHRLSTICKADCIYVLEQGKIVERGDHASLMRRNGRYAELVRLQRLDK